MSARNPINDQQTLARKLAAHSQLALPRRAALSAKDLAAAVKSGEIVGAPAAGLRLLAAVKAPVPAGFRAALQTEHFPAATAERALVSSIAPHAYSNPSNDAWAVALQVVRDSKNYKAAQQLLDARAKSMREFFDGWAESMRRNAKLDKEASIRSHKRTRTEQKISQVRQKINAGLLKLGATEEQLIPSTKGGETSSRDRSGSVGAPRAGAVRRNSRAARRNELPEADSFEMKNEAPAPTSSHQPAPERPDADIGVLTGPRRRRR